MTNFFKVLHQSSKSKARLGEIHSDHGVVKTPAFISAATKGTIKTLTPQQVKEIGIQGACVNTYHLVTHPGADTIEKAGGIQKYSGLNIFTMSDSGGFQVFSLAREQRKANIRGDEEPFVIKISEDGVKFRSTFDGALIEFTPEKSMEFQRKIGADINMAFDECTYYPATHEYAEKAMKRTHEWLKRCIDTKRRWMIEDGRLDFDDRKLKIEKNKNGSNIYLQSSKPIIYHQSSTVQFLYGVIQGGTFEDLRKKSAEFVVSQGTPGVAIGGVSVGESKKEMRDQVKWVSNYLPKDRPVHLLGVGQIDDIIDLVKYGVDTFDCVEPTRLARMGEIYKAQHLGQLSSLSKNTDITKSIYKNNFEKVDVDCECYVCQNFTKSYLHHLFKQREILGYTLATFHNLRVMEKLFEEIRKMISNDLI